MSSQGAPWSGGPGAIGPHLVRPCVLNRNCREYQSGRATEILRKLF